ncbi:MAG: hypothetical protein HYW57_06485 [Ignavibacteriales bacterium]|nr:hypothetical protein [Ignavibacteriales bacterium]
MDNCVHHLIFVVLVLSLVFVPSSAYALQQAGGTQDPGPEIMMPGQFTQVLKEVWTFLKGETENYLASIERKDEFETAVEFERKVTDSRRQYLAKVIKYSRDQKLDQRVFGVLFKASLESYDADKQLYTVSSSTVVDAPYNIPTVQCVIRRNSYVYLADSIRAGYRTSSLYVRLPSGTKWQVSRDLAKAAKTEEPSIYFRANVKIDIEKADFKDKAILELVPVELAFLNNASDQVYWAVPIR